eukprot:9333872-Ditylum_brightwellii.AAC.1
MSRVAMRKYDKPSVLMDQIKAIEVKFSNLNKKMDEEDKITLVFEKAPSNYAGILATTEKEK